MTLLANPSAVSQRDHSRYGRVGPESAPQTGRVIGLVYLVYFLLAVASQLPLRGVVVAGDAATTANNMLAHQGSYGLALALGLASTAAYVAVTALFYALFSPVDPRLSRLAAFFSLTGCAVQAFSSLFQAAPLAILSAGQQQGAFNTLQRQALAEVFLKLHAQGVGFSLVFFGLYCLLVGWLIFRSGFLPRPLGVLMIVAGLGWLTFLWPPLAHAVTLPVQGAGLIAEAALMLWLLVRGVGWADAPARREGDPS